MIDDLASSDQTSNNGAQIELVKYADIISQYCTDRKSSQRWARNLRFLTFDEEGDEDENTIVRSSVGLKRQCQQCEENLKPLPGHVCAAHRLNADSKYLKAREKGIVRYPDICVHVKEATCQDCEHIPLFPNGTAVSRLRIRRLRPKDVKPSELSGCNHFVAVSYCWSSMQEPTSKASTDCQDTYKVVEEDGVTVRAARAPKSVLDRAIGFARQNGVRMIWIDQECIQQEDEKEKSIGVQAMDMVYSRAFFSIGLFQTGFKDQDDLDAFCTLGQGDFRGDGFLLRPGRCKPPLATFVDEQAFVDMLHRLSNERWLSRSWIFQESFASAGEMVILMPKPEAQLLSTYGRNILCNDLSTTEVAIKFDLLDQVLKKAVTYFNDDLNKDVLHFYGLDCSKRGFAHLRELELLRREAMNSIIRRGDEEVKKPENWSAKLALLGRLYPEVLTTTTLPRISYGIPVHFRPCNAAVALSFLVDRHNSVPADRLAIVANLCDYHVRLDVMKVHRSSLPMSACIFMLAFMNGDFSLVCPDSYKEKIRSRLINTDPTTDKSFSWLRVSVTDLKHLSQKAFSPDNHSRGRDDPSIYSLTGTGLSLPGCLWEIDKRIDFGDLQRQYRPGWKKLQARRAKKSPVSSDKLEEEYRLAITHILFEILLQLKSVGEVNTANAIWQSTFDSRWRVKPGQEAIEDVTEWPQKLQVHNRAGMFRIEADESGDYYCSWLIDRVMTDGYLWVGSLVNGSFETALEGFESKPSTSPRRTQLEQLIETLTQTLQAGYARQSSKKSHWRRMEHTGAQGVLQGKKQEKAWDAEKRISHGMWQYLEANMRSALDDFIVHIDGIDLDAETSLTTEGILTFCWAKFFATTTDDHNYFGEQRAVFDIDGDLDGNVKVFSPFRRTLELLPTPATRAMSNSWVVEPVDLPRAHHGQATAQVHDAHLRMLRTGKMVRGMWPLQDIPGTQYRLI